MCALKPVRFNRQPGCCDFQVRTNCFCNPYSKTSQVFTGILEPKIKKSSCRLFSVFIKITRFQSKPSENFNVKVILLQAD